MVKVKGTYELALIKFEEVLASSYERKLFNTEHVKVTLIEFIQAR